MDLEDFRSTVNSSHITLRVGYIGYRLQYVVALDKALASVLLAAANALTVVLVGLVWCNLQLLISLHHQSIRHPQKSLKAFMVLAMSHRGYWRFSFDTWSLRRRN